MVINEFKGLLTDIDYLDAPEGTFKEFNNVIVKNHGSIINARLDLSTGSSNVGLLHLETYFIKGNRFVKDGANNYYQNTTVKEVSVRIEMYGSLSIKIIANTLVSTIPTSCKFLDVYSDDSTVYVVTSIGTYIIYDYQDTLYIGSVKLFSTNTISLDGLNFVNSNAIVETIPVKFSIVYVGGDGLQVYGAEIRRTSDNSVVDVIYWEKEKDAFNWIIAGYSEKIAYKLSNFTGQINPNNINWLRPSGFASQSAFSDWLNNFFNSNTRAVFDEYSISNDDKLEFTTDTVLIVTARFLDTYEKHVQTISTTLTGYVNLAVEVSSLSLSFEEFLNDIVDSTNSPKGLTNVSLWYRKDYESEPLELITIPRVLTPLTNELTLNKTDMTGITFVQRAGYRFDLIRQYSNINDVYLDYIVDVTEVNGRMFAATSDNKIYMDFTANGKLIKGVFVKDTYLENIYGSTLMSFGNLLAVGLKDVITVYEMQPDNTGNYLFIARESMISNTHRDRYLQTPEGSFLWDNDYIYVFDGNEKIPLNPGNKYILKYTIGSTLCYDYNRNYLYMFKRVGADTAIFYYDIVNKIWGTFDTLSNKLVSYLYWKDDYIHTDIGVFNLVENKGAITLQFDSMGYGYHGSILGIIELQGNNLTKSDGSSAIGVEESGVSLNFVNDMVKRPNLSKFTLRLGDRKTKNKHSIKVTSTNGELPIDISMLYAHFMEA